MNPLDGIASRLIGTPLLLTEMKAQEIYGVLESRIFGGIIGDMPETLMAVGRASRDQRPGLSEDKRVAVVDLSGTLVNKASGMQAASGLRSYKAFEDDMLEAATNDKYGAIVLRVNSPGGEVVGIHGAAEAVRQARGEKPVIAVVEGTCASAAFWIAMQANRIVAEKNSQVGSIGAIAIHVDLSAENEKKGRKITIIRSAENKMRFNSAEPLTQDGIDKIEATIKSIGVEFQAAAFEARAGRIDQKGVKALKADVVDAQEGLALGLIDEIGSFRGVIAELFDGAAEGAEEEEVSTFASAQAAVTPEPQTSKEEVAQMEQPTNGQPAAALQPAAADPAIERDVRAGKIANSCAAANCTDIYPALVAAQVSAEECEKIAPIFTAYAHGKTAEERTKLAALIKSGVSAAAFVASATQLLAAADEASPTNTAIVGHEQPNSTFEAKAGKALECSLNNQLAVLGMKLKPAPINALAAGGL